MLPPRLPICCTEILSGRYPSPTLTRLGLEAIASPPCWNPLQIGPPMPKSRPSASWLWNLLYLSRVLDVVPEVLPTIQSILAESE
jgi:hypothetical protein